MTVRIGPAGVGIARYSSGVPSTLASTWLQIDLVEISTVLVESADKSPRARRRTTVLAAKPPDNGARSPNVVDGAPADAEGLLVGRSARAHLASHGRHPPRRPVRHHGVVKRVSVVGNAGSGKSDLARRIAATLDVPHVELDAIHHLPRWTPIDPEEFLMRIGAIASTDGWVIDGNYRTVVVDGPVWRRADTVVWLDLPRHTVMRQVVTRTLRRAVRREELWNGNREPLRNLWAWDPSKSIVRWAWTRHDTYQERFGSAMASPAYEHIDFVRLRSHEEADRWLRRLAPVDRG